MNLNLLRATRENHLKICTGLRTEQLNLVPDGFNNNLIWNAGHVIATQELLTYGLAGLRTPSGREFINKYRKGTRPESPAGDEEIALILDRLLSGVDRLEADLQTLDWSQFEAYPTSYGVAVDSLDRALAFNDLHEAMHLGTMIALRKFT